MAQLRTYHPVYTAQHDLACVAALVPPGGLRFVTGDETHCAAHSYADNLCYVK